MRLIGSFFLGVAFTALVGFTHSSQHPARNVVSAGLAAVVNVRAQITALQCPQVISALGGTCPTVPDGAVTTIYWNAPNVTVETNFPFTATCTVP